MAKKNKKSNGSSNNMKKRDPPSSGHPFIAIRGYIAAFLKKNKRVLSFIAPYMFYIALFTGIYIFFQDRFEILSEITASVLSIIMSFMGVESYSSGQSVYMDGFSVMIIDECTGLYELLVYIGCVLAYPTTINKKMVGIFVGIPAMLLINMLRLVVLSFVGLFYPAFFGYMHYYLWQVTFIFLIVLLFLIWIEKVVKSKSI